MTSPLYPLVGLQPNDRIVPREVPYKNCTNCSTSVHKTVARATDIKKTTTLNSISSIIPWLISTKLDRIVPWEVHHQNCSDHLAPLQKLMARAKNRKKSISSITTWQISTKLDRIVPWEILRQSCSNCSTSLHEVLAARAKNRKKTSTNISSVTTVRFQPNLIG